MPRLCPPSAVVSVLDRLYSQLRRFIVVVAADPPHPPHPLRDEGLSVSDYRVHYHIEDGGRQWAPLCYASLSTEGLYVVPYHLYRHLKPLPISAEEAEVPGTHSISLQDVHAHGPVQCIVCLVKVQEDRVKYRLPHGQNLLEQFDLEGGGPHTAT